MGHRTIKELTETILALRTKKKRGKPITYDAIAKKFGPEISRAVIWRILNEHGYEPTKKEIREALGLPGLAWVTSCPTCGGVHLKKSCPAQKRRRVLSLIDLPDKELRYMLEHREEVTND